jgi:hypothetical protein
VTRPPSELKPLKFDKGTLVHVNGVPFYLAAETLLMGTEGNYALATEPGAGRIGDDVRQGSW